MNNEGMSEQIVTAKIERIRKRRRPRKRRPDDFDEDLKGKGVRDRHTVAREGMEWRGIILDLGLQKKKKTKKKKKRLIS